MFWKLRLATSIFHFLEISDIVVFLLSNDVVLAYLETHFASNVEEKLILFCLNIQSNCM